jgi:adenylate cyclase
VVSLVMNPGLADEQTIVLTPGTVTIGRTKDNEVVCVHKSLSRKHAQLDYDGKKLRIADLQSKNGIFFRGKRVPVCEPIEGDTFRCGDITFLVEDATTRSLKVSGGAQTLPSPLALPLMSLDTQTSRGARVASRAVVVEGERSDRERLSLLIRASELLVGEMTLDKVLDEVIVLAVQVFDVDRIALLTLDDQTLAMKPRVLKTFAGASPNPYSKRVVNWVVDKGIPTSFPDVSQDRSLPGNAKDDAQIRAAMAVPINPGGGTIGVLYADSVSKTALFTADDLALFRALANVAAASMDSHALRRSSSPSSSSEDAVTKHRS